MNDDRPAEPTEKPRSWLTRPLLFKNHPELRFVVSVYFYLILVGPLALPFFQFRHVPGSVAYVVELFLFPLIPLRDVFLGIETKANSESVSMLMGLLAMGSFILSIATPMGTLYLIAWAYRRKRIAVFMILGLGAVAALCTGTAIERYAKRLDWTSHGLNPDREGFVPASVWLSGLATNEASDGSINTRFDLIIAGPEHAYLKLWCKPYHGRIRLLGFDNLSIIIPGHHDTRRWGHHSQSHHFRTGEVPLNAVLSSMWPTNSPVPKATVTEPGEVGVPLRIQAVTNLGNFTVPLKFRSALLKGVMFSEESIQFDVKRIEFHGRPNPKWMRAAYARQFGLPPEETNDLGDITVSIPREPGWSNTGKAKRP